MVFDNRHVCSITCRLATLKYIFQKFSKSFLLNIFFLLFTDACLHQTNNQSKSYLFTTCFRSFGIIITIPIEYTFYFDAIVFEFFLFFGKYSKTFIAVPILFSEGTCHYH